MAKIAALMTSQKIIEESGSGEKLLSNRCILIHNRLKEIAERLEGGKQFRNAAGKEKDADDFKDFINRRSVFQSQIGVYLHRGFRACGHTDRHDNQLTVFARDFNVLFIAVYILLQKHIDEVRVVAHRPVRGHDGTAARGFEVFDDRKGSFQFFRICLFHGRRGCSFLAAGRYRSYPQ